jgi:HEAT repeat protein
VLHTSGSTPAALAEAMELLGRASTDVIDVVLNDPESWGDRMVVAALVAAGHHRLRRSASNLTRFASSKSRDVRAAALHALGSLEHLPPPAATAVLRAFNDRDPAIRSEAARAARLLDPKRVIPPLEELMTDRDWTVRRIAATTLAELGGPGIRTLIATSLVHGDERARNVATQVLVESRTAAELSQEPEKVG